MNTPTLTFVALLGLAFSAAPSFAPQDRGGGGRGAAPPAQRGERAGQQGKSRRSGDGQGREAGGQRRAEEQELMAANYFKVADYDGDGWISYREASSALELNRQRFATFDTDSDGRITLEEFTKVYRNTIRKVGAFKPPIPDPNDPDAISLEELLAAGEEETEEAIDEPLAASVLELFGTVEPREEEEHGAYQPDRIVGPVPSFRRLDYDNDGGISHEDLTELLRGAGIDVRLNTMMASLDTNADGRIDQAEFSASMRSARNP